MTFLRKRLLAACIAAAPLAAVASNAHAQTYPVNNPVFVPSALLAPQTFTAFGDYTFNISGINAVQIAVTGSPVGLAATFQGTIDGTNWVSIPALPAAGGAPVYSISAIGTYVVSGAGYQKVRLHGTALSSGSYVVAAVGSPGAVAPLITVGDPCSNPAIGKSSAVVNVGAATTAVLVAAVAGQKVYVCSIAASLAGTTPSITLITGTQVTNPCDTTPASLSGVILPTSGSFLHIGYGGTVATSIASGQVCGTTVGTGSSFQGVVTFVQM